jgi:hypothetical protein
MFICNCKSYNLNRLYTENINYEIDTLHGIKYKFNDFNTYYRVIYRNTNRLEAHDLKNTDISDSIKITDLQYLFIKKDFKEFLLFSYIPIRNKETRESSNKITYYMNDFMSDFKDEMNLYYLSNFHVGKINDDTIKLIKKHININIHFSRLNDTLIFDYVAGIYSIRKPKYFKQAYRDTLGNIFNQNPFKYIKTNISTVKIYYPKREDTIDTTDLVQPHLTLCKTKNGKKNVILFDYKDQSNNEKSFYFKEKGDRFNYRIPAR